MFYDYVTNRTAYENLHQLQVFEAGQLLGDGAEHVSIQIPGQRNTSDFSENRTIPLKKEKMIVHYRCRCNRRQDNGSDQYVSVWICRW